MNKGKIYEDHFFELKKILFGKNVLIIAPGKSVEDEKEKIIAYAASKDIVSISVNFDYQYCDTDFIFLSNLRRFRELDETKRSKMVVTSNIPSDGVYLQTNYAELLNSLETVRDNAGIMLIKYLIKMGVQKVVLAGIDGYSHDESQNYAERQMAMITRKAIQDAMNIGMSTMLTEYSKQIEIVFLTEPKFVNL